MLLIKNGRIWHLKTLIPKKRIKKINELLIKHSAHKYYRLLNNRCPNIVSNIDCYEVGQFCLSLAFYGVAQNCNYHTF